MDCAAGRSAYPPRGRSPTRWQSHRLHRSPKMSEPNYQFRDYPRAIAERAWQRLAGHHQWITLDRFTAILSKITNDEALSRDLVKSAVCSQAFCAPSGRRLVLFLPKPSPYSRRSEAWRVTAAEYADSTKRFGRIGLLERENAAIMNACLRDLSRVVMRAFRTALDGTGLSSRFFLTQNDGTLMDAAYALSLIHI